MSLARLKRIARLQARQRPPAIVVDAKAAATALREVGLLAAGKICLLPQPAQPETPAMFEAHQLFDRIAAPLAAKVKAYGGPCGRATILSNGHLPPAIGQARVPKPPASGLARDADGLVRATAGNAAESRLSSAPRSGQPIQTINWGKPSLRPSL
jgi:hypothetical protein